MTETYLQKLSRKSGTVPHTYILKEKQQERNSISQNKGLLRDNKTGKKPSLFPQSTLLIFI
jgi:hypothetical protein